MMDFMDFSDLLHNFLDVFYMSQSAFRGLDIIKCEEVAATCQTLIFQEISHCKKKVYFQQILSMRKLIN